MYYFIYKKCSRQKRIKLILECKDNEQSSTCHGYKSAGWCNIDAIKETCMLTCEVCGKYVKFNFLPPTV